MVSEPVVPPIYDFRPLTAADLPLVRRWLATPEVVQWWGDPDEQFALISGACPRGRGKARIEIYADACWR
jgi:hypothetical protein